MVESTIALGLLLAVLVGLNSALTAGARGVVTGRQRSVALALANEVLEQARGRGFAEVGHDLDSDPTLAGDPLLEGVAPSLFYTGVSPAEPLAASSIDAGAGAGDPSNPLFPFSPHRFTTTRDGTAYTTTVYVTWVSVAGGDPYKRISVSVSWAPAQYASTARSVSLSTFLFDLKPPPDPRLVGEAEATSASFMVTGTLGGISLAEARLALPYAYASVDSGFVRRAKGHAGTARSELTLSGGTAPEGCVVDGLRAECPGVKVETGADNDSGTASPLDDRIGPVTTLGGTVAAGTALSAVLGGGGAESLSTARSCWECTGPGPDDDDRLPFQWTQATGPANASVGFRAGSAEGSLLSIGSGCVTGCAVASADRDDVSGVARMTATGALTYPAVDLVTFTGGPAGYAGMVRIAPAAVSATATSGPGATAPATAGGDVTVQMYQGPLLGYQTVTVTPGSPSPLVDPVTTATFTVGLAVVTMTATLHWGPAVVSSTTSGTALTAATASLANWLWVDIHLVVTQGLNVEADLLLHLDYGTVAARATYQAT